MNQQQQTQYLNQILGDPDFRFEDPVEQEILEALRNASVQSERLVETVRQAQEEQKLLRGEARGYAKLLLAKEVARREELAKEEVAEDLPVSEKEDLLEESEG